MSQLAVSVRNLSFGYEASHLVLQDINWSVQKGDFAAIIGPNGGGKSTFLQLITGILQPIKGEIEVFGLPPIKARDHIGYVPQDTNINPHFPIKVLEVVMTGHIGAKRPLFGYAPSEIACAKGALQQVGIEGLADQKITELSGGQRQRVMIARALCAKARLLILDEPTAHIDPSGQHEIYELLRQLNKHLTIIVVSHDLSVILSYANTVAYINRSLSFHDISNKKAIFHTHSSHQRHFCEVELLQMLGSHNCHICENEEG